MRFTGGKGYQSGARNVNLDVVWDRGPTALYRTLIPSANQPREMGLPVHAYTAIDEIKEDATQKAQRVFANLPTEVGATEAEEIGAGRVCGGSLGPVCDSILRAQGSFSVCCNPSCQPSTPLQYPQASSTCCGMSGTRR